MTTSTDGVTGDGVAGHELDAKIAERVMGYSLISEDADFRPDAASYIKPSEVRAYSFDIPAAWQVVRQMRERGWFLRRLKENPEMPETPRWVCTFIPLAPGEHIHFAVNTYGHGEADTAPLAICLAALAALETP